MVTPDPPPLSRWARWWLTRRNKPNLQAVLRHEDDQTKQRQLAPLNAMYRQGDILVGYHKERPLMIESKRRSPLILLTGASGTGKTRLIEDLARQEMLANRGTTIIEHSRDLLRSLTMKLVDTAEKQGRSVSPSLHFFQVPHPDWVLPLNFTHAPHAQERSQCDEIMTLFERKFSAAFSARQTELLKNLLLTISHLKLSLQDAEDLLLVVPYARLQLQKLVTLKSDLTSVVRFWDYYLNLKPSQRFNMAQPLLYKLSAVLGNPDVKLSLCAPGCIDLHYLIQNRCHTFIDLDPAQLYDDTPLFSSLLLVLYKNVLRQAGSQYNAPRVDHLLIMDEFQAVIGLNADEIHYLSEIGRKLGSILLASFHQPSQLPRPLLESLLNNATANLTFQLRDYASARLFARHLYRQVKPQNLHPLLNQSIPYWGEFRDVDDLTETIMALPKAQGILRANAFAPIRFRSPEVLDPPVEHFLSEGYDRWPEVISSLMQRSGALPRASIEKHLSQHEDYLRSFRTGQSDDLPEQRRQKRGDLWQ